MIFYKDGVQASSLSWDAPTTRTDGTAYGAESHAGYELGVNRNGEFTPWVSVPAAYDVTSWPLDELNISTPGTYEVALRTVDTGGLTSAWSNPLVFTAQLALPNPPTNLTILE